MAGVPTFAGDVACPVFRFMSQGSPL